MQQMQPSLAQEHAKTKEQTEMFDKRGESNADEGGIISAIRSDQI